MSDNKEVTETATNHGSDTKKAEKIFDMVEDAGEKAKGTVNDLAASFSEKINLKFAEGDGVPEFTKPEPGDATLAKARRTPTASMSKGRRGSVKPAENAAAPGADSDDSSASASASASTDSEDGAKSKNGKRKKNAMTNERLKKIKSGNKENATSSPKPGRIASVLPRGPRARD